jgi:putative Mn2+ efflux pump MntP
MRATHVHKTRALVFIGYTFVMGIVVVGSGAWYGSRAYELAAGLGGIIWILLLMNWVIRHDPSSR